MRSHAFFLSGWIALVGCGTTKEPAPSTPSGVGAPPARPSAPKTASTETHTFAVRKLFLGDTDRNGAPNQVAWKKYGYNVDGKSSTSASSDVCTPVEGATRERQADGESGIDNSFGKNIFNDIIVDAAGDASSALAARLEEGGSTLIFHITGLDSKSPSTSAVGLSGIMLFGDEFSLTGQKPTWTPSDNWPINPDFLTSTSDPTSGRIRFPEAYTTHGTFVSGAGSDLTFNLQISGGALSFTIRKAVVTFDYKGGKATNGIISGILSTEELVSALRRFAGRLRESFCSATALNDLLSRVRQASDILLDGSNNPTATCDGISIGLGFEAEEIGPPQKVGAPSSAAPDPCTQSDAGPSDARAD